jgi:transposase
MKTYSQDLRERVVRACDEGAGSRQQIAALFGVSTAWIRRLLQRRRQTGSFAALPRGGARRIKMDAPRCDRLVVLVTEQPDASLEELRDRLGAPVHRATIGRALVRLGWTVKKKVFRAAEQDRPDVRRKRAAFRTRAQGIDPDRFLFLDEVGADTAMTRRYGRAPRGARLYDAVPEACWRTTTLIAGVRRSGVVAPLVLEGATDEAVFRTYVEQVLVPVLRPGDIVVLDNLAAHRVGWVARRLRQAGAGVWYLPPYSPEYNPIEKVWAKVKAWLRRAKARGTEALWQAIGDALAAVTPEDCSNCFAHCGYPATFECDML